jgi:SAM-dependent methyltransferase
MPTYGFDHAWAGERDRMTLAESFLDPISTRQLEAVGLDPDWRCLEIGAGAGSIAHWLCQRVGPTGRVVATDIDTRFVDALVAGDDCQGGRLEVLRHDIVADAPLPAEFDLAHTRLVLQHVAAREEAVKRMAAAVVPGGWLVAEEFDFISSAAASPHGADSFERVERAIHTLLSVTGFEPGCGRRLPALLQAAGLVDIAAPGALSVVPGGSPMAVWYRQTIEALRPRLLASGIVAEPDVARAVAVLDDPGFSLMTPVLISARGRKPHDHTSREEPSQ